MLKLYYDTLNGERQSAENALWLAVYGPAFVKAIEQNPPHAAHTAAAALANLAVSANNKLVHR